MIFAADVGTGFSAHVCISAQSSRRSAAVQLPFALAI